MKFIDNYYPLITGFIIFFFVALSKTSLGPDEMTYLNIGTIFLNEGIYTNTKIHPLLSLISASINKLTHSALFTYQIIYGFTGMLLSISIYKLLKKLMLDTEHIKKIHLFVLITPGILLFSLYSIANIFYTALAYFSVYITYKAIESRSYTFSAIAGFFIGLTYLSRIEGLVLIIILLIIIMLLNYKSKESLLSYLCLLITCFVICILPWQIYLANNDLVFSSIIYGGYDSGIWEDGFAKYALGDNKIGADEFSLIHHFLMPIGKNIVLYSEAIASMRTFPFFLWSFVIFGLYEIKFNKSLAILTAPGLATLSYILFFVEGRYVIAAIPLLSILAALGILNLLKRNDLSIKKYFLIALIGIFIMDIFFGILWLYAKH